MSGIIKAPPVIEANVDFEITKDGSNLVSALRNKYNPNVFRAKDPAKKPVENGSGIIFDTVADSLELESEWIPDLINGFSIELDIDLSSFPEDTYTGRFFSKEHAGFQNDVFAIGAYRFEGEPMPTMSFHIFTDTDSQYYAGGSYPPGRAKFVFQGKFVDSHLIIQLFVDGYLVSNWYNEDESGVRVRPLAPLKLGNLNASCAIYGVKISNELLHKSEPLINRPISFIYNSSYTSDTEATFDATISSPPSTVTEFGFVYGKTFPILLENSAHVTADGGESDYYWSSVSDLVNASTEQYYVRSYCKTENEGVTYGVYVGVVEYEEEPG